MTRRILLSFSGPDARGITQQIFSAISHFDLEVIDIEQVVIHKRLSLGILISSPESQDEILLRDQLGAIARRMGLEFTVQSDLGELHAPKNLVHVTLMGCPLRSDAVHRVSQEIWQSGSNIESISRIADRPVTAIEFFISNAEVKAIRNLLTPISSECNVDIAVQPGGFVRHTKRLVLMDVDSTLIENEVIDMLAARAGHEGEVKKITEKAMNGEIDFQQSLNLRVKTLQGLTLEDVDYVRNQIRFTPGALTLIRTLKAVGLLVGVVSGGFMEVIKPIAEELDLDFYRANRLEIENGVLTGRLIGNIIDKQAKAVALREFADQHGVPLFQTVAIGDGANDVDMIEEAGLGIAFHAKNVVRDIADTSISLPNLDSVLFLLGINRSEINEILDGNN